MDTPSARLPHGPRLGDWLLQEHAGGGSYGTVYRAVHAEKASLGAAVKIARYPLDPRFRREAALLEHLRHPHIPRLLDTGIWKSPQGLPYPYLVMEWVEGATLYDWEHVYTRMMSSRQVLQMMAQVARALEAVHAAGGVHRDVKGENVQVSPEGKATLVDFGGCWMEDARPLTDGGVGPGTEAYRSPQVRSFRRRFAHDPEARYVPRGADDLYALGVTVYHWLTGMYPPPRTDPVFSLGEEESELRPPSALASGVLPRLEALVLSCLSEAREERPSAHQLAVEAEEASREAGEEADVPVVRVSAAVREEPPPEPPAAVPSPREPLRWRVPALARLAAMLLAAVGAGSLSYRSHLSPHMEKNSSVISDAGTSRLGEEALTSHENLSLSDWESGDLIARELPKEPLQGQRRPPCAPRGENEINGGCWIEIAKMSPPCGEFFEYNNACYVPSTRRPRPPTSSGKDAQ